MNDRHNSSEQALAGIRDGMPRLWFAIYSGSLTAGFDERQSFALLQTWMLSQNPNGVRPPDCAGPKGDDT